MNVGPIDSTWSLFLDRDGVLNERIVGDYVRKPSQFRWLPGALPALKLLIPAFAKTCIVTNQQGVGKGLMTQEDLDVVHGKLRQQLRFENIDVDAVYACTALAETNARCRKPNIGMAEQAQAEFPEIDLARSIMVGDSPSDIAFGRNAGMQTVLIGERDEEPADARFDNLYDFAVALLRL